MNQQGIFHRARVALFGERAERLRESTSSAHWLSYLLVTVQSAAVVLALGHQQLRLLLSGDPTIILIAALAVFLLVATVWAADLCLLATLQRLPVLARNRATWALLEHLVYVAFVLLVEGSTLALVLAVLDTNPTALVSDAPIIPAGGWMFAAQIAARAALTCWTAVQLWIVRGKLPPQWSTLLLTARELLGGQAERVMAGLNLDDASLASLFDAYAQMSRPPVRVARRWNKGLIAREAAALAEEDRQRESVVRALAAFDVAGNGSSSTSTERPPTGPGSPTAATPLTSASEKAATGHVVALRRPAQSPARRTVAARRVRASVGVRKGGVHTPQEPASYEPQARAAWLAGATSIERMKAATGMSHAAAQGWVRTLKTEQQARSEGQAAQ